MSGRFRLTAGPDVEALPWKTSCQLNLDAYFSLRFTYIIVRAGVSLPCSGGLAQIRATGLRLLGLGCIERRHWVRLRTR